MAEPDSFRAMWELQEGPNLTLTLLSATITPPALLPTTLHHPTSQQLLLERVDFWINGVLTNLIVALGLVGNCLTIRILSQRAMRSSTNYYLSALAYWDCAVLVSTFCLIGLRPVWPAYRDHVYAYYVSYFYPFALIAQTATIWITVSFTVERYIAVCHPLQAVSMCTISRAKIVILVTSLGATLFNIPRWFEYYPAPQQPGSDVIILNTTRFNDSPTYRKVYFSGFYVWIMFIIPVSLLLCLNWFLIRAVRRSRRRQRTMNVKQSRENNVTIMLVTVVIVFVICQMPALAYNIAFAISPQQVNSSPAYSIFSHVRNFMANFNSAVNFLLYCALGQKFRLIFLQTFCRNCQAKPGMHSGGNTSVLNAQHGHQKMVPKSKSKLAFDALVARPKSHQAGKTNGHHLALTTCPVIPTTHSAILCEDEILPLTEKRGLVKAANEGNTVNNNLTGEQDSKRLAKAQRNDFHRPYMAPKSNGKHSENITV